jgi:hypothetical protein
MIIVGGVTLMAFLKPILELRSILTRLEETLKMLKEIMESDKVANKNEHDTFFRFMRETQHRLTIIETRCKFKEEE